jgi:hypothetical protein
LSEHGLITLGLFEDPGYRMPEVSKEADVYNFGILLLEILTDKDPLKSTHLKEELDLPQWLSSFVRKEWTAMVFDVEPREQQQKCGEQECMMRLLQLAKKCCSQDAKIRPTMSYIVQQIDEIYIPDSYEIFYDAVELHASASSPISL